MVEKERQARELLRTIARRFSPAILASSLGPEDMLLLDLIVGDDLAIDVFTLDTGRLFQETHDLLQQARGRYRRPIAVYAPANADIEAYVGAHGPNGFYDSVALRLECCRLRKVKPLKRALAGKRAWITGQRRAQSPTRAALPFQEWDAENRLYKFNPLADWQEAEVWSYIRDRGVPHNRLHHHGFSSIGCAPCSRATAPGEDIRAGRWWWENPDHKECGLHPRRGFDG
jgi:phosphoadenosine phosphosulfate reductase